MQGHLPPPPQPHVPIGLAPVLGYMATREPQPLEERDPVEPEWWEFEDSADEEWMPRHSGVVKVTAVVLAIALTFAGVGTVLEILLVSH